MTDRDIMQQALDALEHIIYWDNEKPEWEYAHAAITALRSRLAQPEQEPVFDCPRCGHCCSQNKEQT